MSRYNVDVHVLTCETTSPVLLKRCLQSLENEPCNVFVIDNSGFPVGPGRARGFAEGAAEFVSYVDCDDYVLPGAYHAVAEGLTRHRSVVTYEQVVDERSGRCAPRLVGGHSVVAYRRADVAPLLPKMARCPWWVDVLTRASLRPSQIDFVGHVRTKRKNTASYRLHETGCEAEYNAWHL